MIVYCLSCKPPKKVLRRSQLYQRKHSKDEQQNDKAALHKVQLLTSFVFRQVFLSSIQIFEIHTVVTITVYNTKTANKLNIPFYYWYYSIYLTYAIRIRRDDLQYFSVSNLKRKEKHELTNQNIDIVSIIRKTLKIVLLYFIITLGIFSEKKHSIKNKNNHLKFQDSFHLAPYCHVRKRATNSNANPDNYKPHNKSPIMIVVVISYISSSL